MKNFIPLIISLIACIGLNAQSDTDVLMTVNGKNITVGEFRYIYEKNNGKEADYTKKSLVEYLDLYAKFKLKVERAKELKIDTIQSLKDELAGYKNQLANSYLMDKEITDQLVKDLYKRVTEDVRFSHIMISINEKSSPREWEEGLLRIKKIKEEIESGKPFEAAVKEYSEDKATKEKGGDLGFFTAMMPLGFSELEQAMYGTPMGKVSAPIKTKIGYHLIKISEKRPARGLIEVAHILIRKDDAKSDPKLKIEELYSKLKSGADFSQLAMENSEDAQTAKSGGILKPFGIGTYEAKFEDAAFAMISDGDISGPIETKSGWHILKRIKKISPQADNYIQFKKINEGRIKKDERYENARKSLIDDIKKRNGFKEDSTLFDKFKATLGEDFLTYKWNAEASDPMLSNTLIFIGNNAHASLKDFIDYAKKNTRSRLKFDKTQTTPGAVADELLKEFAAEKTIQFEQASLESKYPDFKSLLREYDEGILLFEATKLAVWDKANQDSIGLEKYYSENKQNYMSDEKGRIISYVVNSTDVKFVEKVMKEAKQKEVGEVLKKFNKKEVKVISQEETLEKANTKFGGLEWKTGAMSKYELNSKINVYQFRKLVEILPSRPKTLKEAKGYVVADYQEYLEKQWVEELKKSYPIHINDAVLNKLIK